MGSERAIAEKLRLKPSTLRYKLRKFEAEKVILGYKYRLNYSPLGLKQPAWLLIDLKRREFDIPELFEELAKNPFVRYISLITGNYDVAIKTYARDLDGLTRFILGLEQSLHQKIEASSTIVISKNLKKHEKIVSSSEDLNLDKNDLEILSYRLEKPNTSIREISEALGLHRNTVSAKWNSLVKNNVVIKKSIITNPEYDLELGRMFKAFVFFDAKVGMKEELASQLSQLDEVSELNVLAAPHDILALVRTRDINSFYDFHRQLYGKKEFAGLVHKVVSYVTLTYKSNEFNPIKRFH